MKKIVLGSLLAVFVSSASAAININVRYDDGSVPQQVYPIVKPKEATQKVQEYNVKTVVPYFGGIGYENSANKSIKDKSLFGGLYASIGNLSYLSEFSYGYLNTSYKNGIVADLKQHDIAFMHSKYYRSYMFKGGLHYINTNDTVLGDGIILITALGGYTFKAYEKYSYGVEGYYSHYKDGHDENGVQKSISMVQFTPYFGFYKAIDINNKNSLNIKFNYEIASDYAKKSYSSFEVSDTYYYRRLFSTLKACFGEMKTGVKDGGIVVYNSLDLKKSGYSLRVGYYLKNHFIISASYGIDSYREYLKSEDAKNDTALFSLSYRY